MGKRSLVLVGDGTAGLRKLLEEAYDLTIVDEASACDAVRETAVAAVIVAVASLPTARALADRLREVVAPETLVVGVGEGVSLPWHVAAFDYWFESTLDLRELHAILSAAPDLRR